MDIRSLNIKNLLNNTSLPKQINENNIAVICYGHLRSFLKCVPITLKTLSDYGNLDIYLHTWDCIDLDSNDSDLLEIPSIIEGLTNDYNLISLKIDKQNIDNDSLDSKTQGLHCMYYSMWSANQLKKNVENKLLQRYKNCFKMRPDILFEPKKNIYKLSENSFFSNQGKTHFDIVAYTSSMHMDAICSYISKINLNKNIKCIQDDYYNFLKNTLKLNDSEYEYLVDWSIVRSKYEKLL